MAGDQIGFDWETDTRTRSTGEALALLKRERALMIEQARRVAIELIRSNGTTTSREVLHDMEARGYLSPSRTQRDFWLGAVFCDPRFTWTGHYHVYSETEPTRDGRDRNIHKGTIKVWMLTPGVAL